MPSTVNKVITILVLAGLSLPGLGQEFLDDDTMKLTEVSLDKNYGRKPKRNIKVGSIDNIYKYINALTGPNGESIFTQRLGSCWAVGSAALLSAKRCSINGKSTTWIWRTHNIYTNGYDYDNPNAAWVLEGIDQQTSDFKQYPLLSRSDN